MRKEFGIYDKSGRRVNVKHRPFGISKAALDVGQTQTEVASDVGQTQTEKASDV